MAISDVVEAFMPRALLVKDLSKQIHTGADGIDDSDRCSDRSRGSRHSCDRAKQIIFRSFSDTGMIQVINDTVIVGEKGVSQDNICT